MKTVRLFFALCAALFAVGCASVTPVITGDSPQAQAGNAIAQAEVALIKGYRLVADQAAAGVLFKSELQDIMAALDKAAAAVDKAKKLYSVGSFQDALNNALDADKALNYVESEVAKKLRERRSPPANNVSWIVPIRAPATTAEQKTETCVYAASSFGIKLVEALNKGVPPELVRQAISARDPVVQKTGEQLLDAILSRDETKIESALNAMVARCVFILTEKEKVKV